MRMQVRSQTAGTVSMPGWWHRLRGPNNAIGLAVEEMRSARDRGDRKMLLSNIYHADLLPAICRDIRQPDVSWLTLISQSYSC
jgi:signal transduction histidine kinase